MNCKAILTTAAAGAVLSVFSAVPVPEVTVSGMSQDSKGVAIISYTLSSADAVVTLDIETNVTGNVWASIGGAAVSSAQGDVWKRVEIGSRAIKWDGASCWTDHKIPANGIRAVVTAWSLDNTPDYMAVDISSAAQPDTQTYYPAADFVPGGVSNGLYKTTMLLMRKIMAKDVKWTMGSVAEANRMPAREATHLVTLSDNYYIGVFEVTQSQWEQVTGYNPSYFTYESSMRPVENVCYNDVRHGEGAKNSPASATGGIYPDPPNGNSFLGKLRTTTGIDFDLPSEAQWEFAARAGHGEGYWGNGAPITRAGRDPALDELGRYNPSGSYNGGSNPPAATIPMTEGGTAIVGTYIHNSWGLYDMHGNVNELCLDALAANISSLNGAVNIVLDGNSTRVFRGGSWASSYAYECRSSYRSGPPQNGRRTHVGLRVACPVELQ